MVSESIQVKSSTTTLELVPELLRQFLPQLSSMEVPPTHHSYIVLMQGESKWLSNCVLCIVVQLIDTYITQPSVVNLFYLVMYCNPDVFSLAMHAVILQCLFFVMDLLVQCSKWCLSAFVSLTSFVLLLLWCFLLNMTNVLGHNSKRVGLFLDKTTQFRYLCLCYIGVGVSSLSPTVIQ